MIFQLNRMPSDWEQLPQRIFWCLISIDFGVLPICREKQATRACIFSLARIKYQSIRARFIVFSASPESKLRLISTWNLLFLSSHLPSFSEVDLTTFKRYSLPKKGNDSPLTNSLSVAGGIWFLRSSCLLTIQAARFWINFLIVSSPINSGDRTTTPAGELT